MLGPSCSSAALFTSLSRSELDDDWSEHGVVTGSDGVGRSGTSNFGCSQSKVRPICDAYLWRLFRYPSPNRWEISFRIDSCVTVAWLTCPRRAYGEIAIPGIRKPVSPNVFESLLFWRESGTNGGRTWSKNPPH